MAISILKKIIIPVLLFHILSLAFFLTVELSHDTVFQTPIRYAADDGVYHMRLVENMLLGGHFPRRIQFDPFTYFPFGTYIHFAPLYSFLIAAVIWLVSLGRPTLELINQIAPFFPPVLNALTIIVIYFIGSVLWNKWAGLFSAFLMAISPPFLFRSLLGTTDHHQAEVLFSSLAILFLILSFKNRGKKSLWPWTILTGIGFGLYFLTWNGALLFLFILFIFLVLYYLIEYLSGRPQNRIPAMGFLIFLITFLMILPFRGYPDIYNARLYNIQHYGSLILGMLGFLTIWLLAKFIKRIKLNAWALPILLSFFGFFFLLMLKAFFEPMFLAIIESFRATKIGLAGHELAREIVGEMRPLDLRMALGSFGHLFYLSFIAWMFIIYDFIKKRRAENLLMIVWFLVIVLITGILIPTIGQMRFVYYLSANISLLAGFLAVKGIGFAVSGWRISKDSIHKNYLRLGSILLFFNIVFFVFYPFPFNLIESFPNNLPKIINKAMQTGISGTIQREADWYETLKWLRENTPDPGLDYYAFYRGPKFNPETGKIDPYPYPETAYGVLAAWDVGHMITYYGRRLPNANPFQQGLGRIENGTVLPGETTFFIETDEKKALQILDELKTRYIITNNGSAEARQGFRAKVLWAKGEISGYYIEEGEESKLSSSAETITEARDEEIASASPVADAREGEDENAPNERYYQSMIVRLHYFDGKDLSRFRLVYESKTKVTPSIFSEEENDSKNEVKMIKVFEYVKGATIRGNAPEGALVKLSANITTNQNRKFVYEKNVEVKGGIFEFVVPYSTEGENSWLENGTKFEVFAEPYLIKINGMEKTINVSENEVMEGKEININF